MSATSLHVSHESFTPQAKSRLFWMSVFALLSAGMTFATRADVLQRLGNDIFTGTAATAVATAAAFPFLGFAVSIILSSPLLDKLGMGKLLGLSALLMTIGIVMVIFTKSFDSAIGPSVAVGGSFFIFGLGWGLVEAVINPLIATVYADDKTHKLNNLHAWWPAGLIIGGLIGLYFENHHLPWRIELAIPLIPVVIYGFASVTMRFPATERKAAGISDSEMFNQLANPLFILIFACMFLTASSELAPNAWLPFALTQGAHMPAIILVVYVSGLMFVMRHFAGPLAHKLSPIGLLWFSAILACAGLYLLSLARSQESAFIAATVWGTGVCFMWPTMLAMTSERFPRGGSLLMGLMGAAGMGSIFFVLPILGKVYDAASDNWAVSHGYASFKALQTGTTAAAKTDVIAAQINAGTHSFQANAMIPGVLIVVFAGIWLYDRSKGGYRAVALGSPVNAEEAAEEAPASVY